MKNILQTFEDYSTRVNVKCFGVTQESLNEKGLKKLKIFDEHRQASSGARPGHRKCSAQS